MGLLSWLESAGEARRTREALAQAFAQWGIDFMQLHPAVRGVILKDAMAFKHVGRTVKIYLEVVQSGHDLDLDDVDASRYLSSVYERQDSSPGSSSRG